MEIIIIIDYLFMIFVLIFISITSLVKSQTEIPCTPVESNILYSPNDGKCYLGIQ